MYNMFLKDIKAKKGKRSCSRKVLTSIVICLYLGAGNVDVELSYAY